MRLSVRSPRVQDGLVVVVALLLTAFYVWAGGGGFALDDAWIHQTYARNLGLYGEWAFVRGVPSAASTSPLYTILLAAGYVLGVPFTLWTHGLGATALAGIGLLAIRLARRLTGPRSLAPLAAGLACVGSWHLIWAAASGMETALFAMWTLALILLAWREIDAQRPRPWLRAVVFGAAAALTMLTRPEGLLLTGLCGLALLMAHPRRSLRVMLGWLLLAGGVWLLFMLPYFVSNLQLAGSLLPGTNAAKVVALSVRYELPLHMRFAQIASAMFAGAQLLLLPGVVVYSFRFLRIPHRSSSSALFLVPIIWALALPALYSLWMPFWEQHGRYVIPAIPSLVVTGVIGSYWLLKRVQRQSVM
ncbi:MAG: hypothetical protein JNL34_16550, partial [Anaerolineae bacterium]|nr:hypothetical protein [Anaerolineae bacterium]